MAVKDHMRPGFTMKQRVKIITVDPPNRRVQAMLRDGSPIQIGVAETPNAFRWPKTGEEWVVRRDQGLWVLDSHIDPPDSDGVQRIEDLKEGESLLKGDHFKTTDGRNMLVVAEDDVVADDFPQWDSGLKQWVPRGKLDAQGRYLLGPNPSYHLNPDTTSRWLAMDFMVDAQPLAGKLSGEDRGGSGRLFVGRGITVVMVNDPADVNGFLAYGSPTGNFFIDVQTYRTGTVTATNGSSTITGLGTTWIGDDDHPNVLPEQPIMIKADTQARTVKKVVSNTQIILHSAYEGPTNNGKTYIINGTANVVDGSDEVTGTGTNWTPALVNETFALQATPSVTYRIKEVPDGQTLVLTQPYEEADNGDADYVMGFDGYPYGKNGDGTELYEPGPGALVMSQDAGPMISTGGTAGGVARTAWHGTEQGLQHTLEGHLSGQWNSGDSTIRLVEDPALLHIAKVNTRGEDQGFFPIRDHCTVTLSANDGTRVTVDYSAIDSANKKLLGCTDTSSGKTADIGKTVTQVRLHLGGKYSITTVPKLGYRLGGHGITVQEDSGTSFGPAAETGRQAWMHVRGGRLRIEPLATPSVTSYEPVGTGPGSTRWNYYFVFKNTSPGTTFGDIGVVKIHVPDGQGSYGTNNYLKLTVATLPTGWLKYDVVRVPANVDQTDASATYTSIAEEVSVRHGNTSNVKAVAVDFGQVVDPAYAMPEVRNTTGDLEPRGFLDRTQGHGQSFPQRTIGTLSDGRVPGQDITADGTDEEFFINASAGARTVYLPTAGSKQGRRIFIMVIAGGNTVTAQAVGSDVINGGGSTYGITGVNTWVELRTQTAPNWRAWSS